MLEKVAATEYERRTVEGYKEDIDYIDEKLRGKRKKNKKLVEKPLTNRKKTVIIMDVVKYVPLAQLDRATAF